MLKSRNNYNVNLLYKCISTDSCFKALTNHEIWMQKIEYLNDKRENKVIKELFEDKTWIKYEWARNVEFNCLPNSYVCSYSKASPNSEMKDEYGSNVFGYKSDRISDVLAPIVLIKGRPFLDQVACYDILYNQDEAKKEINYLCDLINIFEITKDEKNEFLNDILIYWYLSIKDEKWVDEQERRYQLFIFDYKDYKDLSIDDRFLKIKSSVYLLPDFIFSNDSLKYEIELFRKDKLNSIAMNDYIYCHNCLQSDFDSAKTYGIGESACCSICGSTDIELIELRK